MSSPPSAASDAAALFASLEAGEQVDVDVLFPVVYAELRRVARAHLRHEPDSLALSTTDLVHEVYLRLKGTPLSWQGRARFLSLASHAMRQMLVQAARRRRAAKRGHGVSVLSLGVAQELPLEARADALVALDEALNVLAEQDEIMAAIVECRFFGGLTMSETAEALGLSVRTAERSWTRARAYLADLLTVH